MNLGKKGTSHLIKNACTPSQKKKTRTYVFVLISVFLIFTLLMGNLASLGLGMVNGILDSTPKITENDVKPNQLASTIYDSQGKSIQTLVKSGSNRINIKEYSTIPQDLINAFVAIEDARFWEHSGIDLKGIVRAAAIGLSSGSFSEGASTITQQLIKNSVFSDWMEESSFGASLERKIQEQYLAIYLEKKMDKDDILLNYLNTINLGSNTLGVASATKRYFGKSYSELSLTESVVIAAITNNPTAYNPITHPEKNAKRAKKVLKLMKEQDYITSTQEKSAIAELDSDNTIYAQISAINDTYSSNLGTYSYFTDAVIEQVVADLQTYRGYTQTQAYQLLYSGGLQIYTTLDQDIQDIIEDEVNNETYYPDECTEYSCTFTLTVTHKDGSSDDYTESDLKSYFRSVQGSDFKFIQKTKDRLLDLINEFADSIVKKTDTTELTSINYTLQPQVSFVLMEQDTGYVRGISGGRGEKTSSLSLNRATTSLRQPGSTFKTLAAFAPALDKQGSTLSSVYYDAPYRLNGKSFSNYWGNEFLGYSTIRQSIVYSMNIVALKCMNETVGIDLAYQYLEDFGFSTLVDSKTTDSGSIYTDKTASLCLGGLTDGVSNLENTAAYAAIANNGVYNRPVFYTQILDQDGNILIDNTKPESHTVIKKTTAFLLTNAMEEVMNGGNYPGISYLSATGKAANVKQMSIAGKTGTTTSKNDIWFIGYSPYYTAGVWSGYDDNKTIDNSENYHKKIWSAIMTRIDIKKNLANKKFTKPSEIVSCKVCQKSGLLAIDGVCDCDPRGDMVYTEYFVKGSEPTKVCNKHTSITICTRSGKVATKKCPASSLSTRIYMLIDPTDENSGDTVDSKYTLSSTATCTYHLYSHTPITPITPSTQADNTIPSAEQADE